MSFIAGDDGDNYSDSSHGDGEAEKAEEGSDSSRSASDGLHANSSIAATILPSLEVLCLVCFRGPSMKASLID